MAAPSQMAAGKYRSYGGKVSLFTLLLAAYSSRVIMRGTGCIFKSLTAQQLEYSLKTQVTFHSTPAGWKDLEFSFSKATDGRERLSFQQNAFAHVLLANLGAHYPKLWLFLSLAVICLVRHMACPGCCILIAELGILGHRLPTQTGAFSTHPLQSQLSAVVLFCWGTAS